MNDRKRLIELFKEMDKDFGITCPNINTDKDCKGCKYQMSGALLDCNYLERKVDYLFANGVIAPPCNVGDTAYFVTNTGHIRYLTVTHIDIKLRRNETKIICRAVFDLDGRPCEIEIVPSKIGEIYFFNLEDAEQALKERAKSGEHNN